MRDEIVGAIQGRRLITFTYSGIVREVMPCAVGVSHAGNEVLRCYQVQGGHVEAGHDWDLCELSKIRNLVVTNKTFDNAPPGYRRRDRGMTRIYAEL